MNLSEEKTRQDSGPDRAKGEREERKHKISIGSREIGLPRSRSLRIALGIFFIIGGMLGFLPILGFWMVPLGLLILSVDLPFARRLRRRLVVWWHRWRERRQREGDE